MTLNENVRLEPALPEWGSVVRICGNPSQHEYIAIYGARASWQKIWPTPKGKVKKTETIWPHSPEFETP